MSSPTTTSRPPGTLYIIGTPIGHPDDITVRALRTLRLVPVIAAEDPLATQSLLTHHGIATTVTSYGPRNRHEKVLILLDRLRHGQDIAIVSDNGMPIIYDPGSALVKAACQSGIPVTIIPGASAFTAATAISGFSGDALIFEGRLPSTIHGLEQYVASLCTERRTLAFYADNSSLRKLLTVLTERLPDRSIAVAVDLTRNGETVYRGTADQLIEKIPSLPKSSAVTVIIKGYRGKSEARMKGNRKARTTRRRDDE